ncbi:Sedoheptulokinase [Chionoecetes opilio]|uniref:Sedoheptulokinase n=1 Tax=Chionoecetes opilio TaxID=41210 RepID=A0A8J4YF20_CHIOP|nr:Sedoheptulokinase [Chionoecetes opilio]
MVIISNTYLVQTLHYLVVHLPNSSSSSFIPFRRFNRAATIQDFLVCMLCDLNHPVMSLQNAASWGFLNTETKEWNTELLQGAGLPLEFLPQVVDSGQEAGRLQIPWYGIPAGTPVLASMGDLQCSVLPLLSKNTEAIINISTSAQICYKMPQVCCVFTYLCYVYFTGPELHTYDPVSVSTL